MLQSTAIVAADLPRVLYLLHNKSSKDPVTLLFEISITTSSLELGSHVLYSLESVPDKLLEDKF